MAMRQHAASASLVVALAAARAACWRSSSPGYFSRGNLPDLLLANVPVLVAALGMTLVILSRRDRHLGRLAVRDLRVVAGVWREGRRCRCRRWRSASSRLGALFGALNGALVAWLGLPSIVVTLATLVALRDALRWATQGAWVQDLPATFQWFGLVAGVLPGDHRRGRDAAGARRPPGRPRTSPPGARSTRPARTRGRAARRHRRRARDVLRSSPRPGR